MAHLPRVSLSGHLLSECGSGIYRPEAFGTRGDFKDLGPLDLMGFYRDFIGILYV